MLFQPSNVTPSSFAGAGGGTVAVSDTVTISWQVNGNSALTSYSFEIFPNTGDAATDALSVWSSGTLVTGCPFYGKDEKGNPQQFTYTRSGTWTSLGLSDGENYRLVITQNYSGGSVVQTSPSAFITRTAPTLTITAFTTPVASVIQTFTASFSQSDGDTVNSVRWTLIDNTDGGNVLVDTGAVNTGVLSFTYNGFFADKNYTLACTVESSSGVTVTTSETFDVEYENATATNNIELTCNADNSVTLSWAPATDIPGTADPTTGYSIDGGVLALDSGASVTWNTVDGESMSIAAPYGLSTKFKAPISFSMTDNPVIAADLAAISADGSVLATSYGEQIYVYDVSGGVLTERYSFYTANAVTPTCLAVSPDGQYCATASGSNTLVVYDISGASSETVVQSSNAGFVYSLAFSPDGTYLGVGLQYTARFFYGANYASYTEAVISLPGASWTTGDTFTFTADGAKATAGIKTSGGLHCYELSNSEWTVDVVPVPDATAQYAFAPDGTHLIGRKSSSGVYTLTLLELNSSAATVVDTKTYSYSTASFAVSFAEALNGFVLYGAIDGTLLADVWEATGNALYKTASFAPFAGSTTCAVISADGATAFLSNGSEAAVFTASSMTTQVLSINSGALAVTLSGSAVTIASTSTSAIVNAPTSWAWVRIDMLPSFDMEVYFISVTNAVLSQTAVTLEQPTPITSIALQGESVTAFVYITTDTDDELFTDGTATPSFDASTIFFANFTDGLNAGTYSQTGTIRNAIYREHDSELFYLGEVPSAITQFRDYGIKSGEQYTYRLFYVEGDTYSSAMTSATMCRKFNSYTLIEASADIDNPNVYHVIQAWRFGANINASAISNNNAPTMLSNFTRYPYRQPSSQAGRSGTLAALISNVENCAYSDTAEQMDALFELSHSTSTLFLKDMKGNLYMVHTAGAITQSINTTSGVQQVTVSIPWQEIGDATGIALIQSPQDTSWEE